MLPSYYNLLHFLICCRVQYYLTSIAIFCKQFILMSMYRYYLKFYYLILFILIFRLRPSV